VPSGDCADEDFPNEVSVREAAMATKARAKAKRKKTTVTKTARRRKTVRKTRTIRKKAAKKAPPRRTARTKAKSTAKIAVKPTPVSQRAQPEAVKPPPSRAAQPTAAEQRIGVVTHYYSHLSVVRSATAVSRAITSLVLGTAGSSIAAPASASQDSKRIACPHSR
jgi:hypothetical protein